MRVLILDADNALGNSMANNFATAGHEVFLHARTGWQQNAPLSGIELVEAADPVEQFAEWFELRGSPHCVVFNLKAKDELGLLANDGDIEGLINQLSGDLLAFLREIQAFAMLLARAGQGLIWVLVQEDSAGYYVPIPVASAASRARIAAVKSLAKEVARLGVKINAISVQAYREQLELPVWSAAHDGLKAYALKFKPIDANSIADAVRRLSESSNLPIVGMVLPIGIGMPEFNI